MVFCVRNGSHTRFHFRYCPGIAQVLHPGPGIPPDICSSAQRSFAASDTLPTSTNLIQPTKRRTAAAAPPLLTAASRRSPSSRLRLAVVSANCCRTAVVSRRPQSSTRCRRRSSSFCRPAAAAVPPPHRRRLADVLSSARRRPPRSSCCRRRLAVVSPSSRRLVPEGLIVQPAVAVARHRFVVSLYLAALGSPHGERVRSPQRRRRHAALSAFLKCKARAHVISCGVQRRFVTGFMSRVNLSHV